MISTNPGAAVLGDAELPETSERALLRGPRNSALALLAGYLAVSGLMLAAAHPWLALTHAAGIATAVWGGLGRRGVARTIGDLLPLFVAPILYGEVPLL